MIEPLKQALAQSQSVQDYHRVASALQNAGEWPAAIEVYQALLAKFGDVLNKREKDPVQLRITELLSATGTLVVTSPESGASVSIDGRPVGVTPLAEPVRVMLGPHVVEVAKEGFVSWRKAFVMPRGVMLSMDAPLTQEQMRAAHVEVHASGGGESALQVDGKPMGFLPWSGELPAGKHVFVAQGAQGIDTATLELSAGARHIVRLDPKLDSKQKTSVLRIRTNDPDATIEINGVYVGKQTSQVKAKPGNYRVRVHRPGGDFIERDVTVTAGQQLELELIVPRPGEAAPVTEGSPVPPVEDKVEGLFFRGSLAFPTMLTPKHQFSDTCPNLDLNSSCGGWNAPALAFDMRLGYNFGWWGPELMLRPFASMSTRSIAHSLHTTSDQTPFFGVPRTEDYVFTDVGTAVGIALRASTPGRVAQFTGAVAPGLVLASSRYSRTARKSDFPPDLAIYSSPNIGRVVPMLDIELGLLLGESPGTRFFLGVSGRVEFSSEQLAPGSNDRTLGMRLDLATQQLTREPHGTPPIVVHRAWPFAIVPMLGLRFGN